MNFLFTLLSNDLPGARGGLLPGGQRYDEQRSSGGGGADEAAVGECRRH